MISRLVCAQLNIPVIYTVHGWGFGKGRRKFISLIVYIIEKFLVHFTDKYISVSEEDRRIGLNSLGINTNSIITIHNGISLEPVIFDPSLKKATLIMVARDDPQKDYTTLLIALSTAKFEKALIVGRGTDSPVFKKRAYKLAKSGFDRIEFLGPRSDVENLITKCCFFVLSSNFEGLPLSIIEAMSKGLPIIASNVGGVNELVVHGENGFLFQRGDSDALSDYISLLSNDMNLCISLGEKSTIMYMSKFKSNIMISSIIDVYKEVYNK